MSKNHLIYHLPTEKKVKLFSLTFTDLQKVTPTGLYSLKPLSSSTKYSSLARPLLQHSLYFNLNFFLLPSPIILHDSLPRLNEVLSISIRSLFVTSERKSNTKRLTQKELSGSSKLNVQSKTTLGRVLSRGQSYLLWDHLASVWLCVLVSFSSWLPPGWQSWLQQFEALYGVEWRFPQIHVHPPGTCERGLIWKCDFCRCDQVKMRSYWV